MSTILDRLHAAFRGTPIVLAPIRARGRPGPAQLREVADHLAALANHPDGGILVLGIDAEAAIAIRGVTEPKVWAAATRRVAAQLVPPVPVEVEVGEERGRAVLAAQVPFVPVPHGLVRRRDGAPTRLVDGHPVPQFRPLKGTSPGPMAPILAPVARSTPAWLDPEATRALAPRAPAAWSPATREAMAREGLLAADGVAVTRAGMLLAGLAEQRAEADGVIVEADSRVVDLPRGWVLLREDLRFEARQTGVRHADLVADLVVDVIVRTASPSAVGPIVVDLSPDLLTIEVPGPIRDDAHLARLMARWGAWRKESWKAAAIGWHLPVTWERHGAGLRVVARLVRPELAAPERAAPRSIETAPPSPVPAASPTPRPEAPPTASEVHVARSTREDAVLELLADGRSWSRRELDARLGWSRSTVRNVLEGLVSAGRVVTEAPSARSPHQAYRRAASAPEHPRSPGSPASGPGDRVIAGDRGHPAGASQ
jgi:hypothetical protein